MGAIDITYVSAYDMSTLLQQFANMKPRTGNRRTLSSNVAILLRIYDLRDGSMSYCASIFVLWQVREAVKVEVVR